ncbi:D-2-hydroxyacid dehydrogenase [Tistrella bauzanensis]|jgi:phosphoglycerate dehydrogenase-like enzyme|uniref:D-2-hydroxyacid dehydrogenase n=1 Tax=Tistrella TaxID=171436 RepID=UPI0031F61609
MRIAVWTPNGRDMVAAKLTEAGHEPIIAQNGDDFARALADGVDAIAMISQYWSPKVRDLVAAARPRLKLVQLLTAGFDPLDGHGVPDGLLVANAGGAYSPTVAEHALTMMLALIRRLPDAAIAHARQEWDRSIQRDMGSLEGRTVTMLGFGSIGVETARRLKPFGARVIAATRSASPHPLADEVVPIGDLASVLPRTDVLYACLPLGDATRGLIGRTVLDALPDHALVINVARGAVVDKTALLAALLEGRIGGAGLDVTDPEPLPADDPLWRAPNLIITPHVAGNGSAAVDQRLAAVTVDNVNRLAAGAPLTHLVTPRIMD